MSSLATVTVAAGSAADLRVVVSAVVRERLAAYANIFAVTEAVYLFEGELQVEPEAVAVLHTNVDRAALLIDRIRELHPYPNAQILAHHVAITHPVYANWLNHTVR